MKKKIFTKMFILRLDDETDTKLKQLSGSKKGNQSAAIRDLIKSAPVNEPGRKPIELLAI